MLCNHLCEVDGREIAASRDKSLGADRDPMGSASRPNLTFSRARRRRYLSRRRQQHLQTAQTPYNRHPRLQPVHKPFYRHPRRPTNFNTRLRAPAKRPITTMPTPESEMFKAAKPTVPPTFDGVDYDDNKALKAAQDSVIREQWVQSMMARLVREELGKCYYREGVNHLEKCGHLRGKRKKQTKHTRRSPLSFGCCGWNIRKEIVLMLCAFLSEQIATWSSSSTRRSRATCSSSRTTCPRSRVVN